MIDIDHEDLIDLRTACRERVFRTTISGKGCHISSMYRHVLRGARAADGQRVKLETIRTPGGLRTSREAIGRFIASLTDPGLPPPTTTNRRKQMAAAEAELREAGFDLATS